MVGGKDRSSFQNKHRPICSVRGKKGKVSVYSRGKEKEGVRKFWGNWKRGGACFHLNIKGGKESTFLGPFAQGPKGGKRVIGRGKRKRFATV